MRLEQPAIVNLTHCHGLRISAGDPGAPRNFVTRMAEFAD